MEHSNNENADESLKTLEENKKRAKVVTICLNLDLTPHFLSTFISIILIANFKIKSKRMITSLYLIWYVKYKMNNYIIKTDS